MPKTERPLKLTATQQYNNSSLAEKVTAAVPLAREILISGIDQSTAYPDDYLVNRVARLIGDEALAREYIKSTDEQAAILSSRLEGAFALGVALGGLVRPDLFTIDGDR